VKKAAIGDAMGTKRETILYKEGKGIGRKGSRQKKQVERMNDREGV